MSEFYRPQGCSSAVFYLDPKAALRFLEEAFGFEPLLVLLDDKDEVAHSEMKFGHSVLMIGREWGDVHRSPRTVGGKNTQAVHVQLARGVDIDAHCDRARRGGGEIVMAPADQFYGDRSYRVRDPEGHVWTFSVTLKELTPADWDKASGLRTKTRL
jgi:uncharacterized glyoxalase superfamily protein PhnB